MDVFFGQLAMLMQRDLKLALRRWPTSVVRILLPAVFLLALWGTQIGLQKYLPESSSVEVSSIPPLSRFTYPNGTQGIALAYTPVTNDTYEYMSILARRYNLTIAKDPNDKSEAYDIVAFDQFDHICSYFDRNPFTGTAAVSFDLANPFNNNPASYQVTSIGTITSPMAPLQMRLADRSMQIYQALDESILTAQAHATGFLAPDENMNLKISFVKFEPGMSAEGIWKINNMVWTFGGPIVFITMLFIHAIYVLSNVNRDRDKKLDFSLMLVGLQRGPYWLSHFLMEVIVSFFSVWIVIITGVACDLPFFVNCNKMVIFFLLWFGVMNSVGATLCIAAVIHKPTLNIAVMVLAWSMSGSLAIFSSWDGAAELLWMNTQTGAAALYQADMGFIIGAINKMALPRTFGNTTVPGFTWNDLYDSQHFLPDFPPALNLLALLGLAIFSLLLAWYINNVSPGDGNGIPRPAGFIFSPYYWGFAVKPARVIAQIHDENNQHSVLSDTDIDIHREYQRTLNSYQSPTPDTPLTILRLSKTFSKGNCACCGCKGGCCACGKGTDEDEHRALDSLTVSGESNSVLCILGHNGAGKTSTLNMLMGSFKPTSGDAILFGKSTTEDIDAIRTRIGVCSQFDILWPELTAKEHIEMFCALKRVPKEDWESVVHQKLGEVNLLPKKDIPVGTYSGGMQRRLSVAIASVGDPDVIFLDEPTTGLDPRNKIKLWKVIEEQKKHRLIVLTTHSMEEADALGDKIVILALGRMRAVGNSLRLKKRFGAGYHIQLVTSPEQVDEVKTKVKEMLPDATLTTTEKTGNLSYNLSFTRVDLVQKFFAFLEREVDKTSVLNFAEKGKKKDKGGNEAKPKSLISDWGISQTTLEEVFMRLTHGDAFTFKRQEEELDGDATEMQLNVAYNNNIIGFVKIKPDTLLFQLRLEIEKFPEAPADFKFTSNGVPVSRVQEKFMIASDFIPICTIEEEAVELDEDLSDDKGGLKEIGGTKRRKGAKSLKEKVVDLQVENTELKETVEVLRRELEETRKELEEKEEVFEFLKKKMQEKKEKKGKK